MKLQIKPRAVPSLREFPNLAYTKGFALQEPVLRLPLPKCFFRPEEAHGCSGVNDILVPAPKRQQKVNDCACIRYTAGFNFEANGIARGGAN